jgi:hypothetical protein
MANGFETFLSKIGKDIKGVFAWVGSPQGKAVVAGAETATSIIVGAVNPALVPAVNGVEGLVNAGLQNAISVEALSAAAAAQSGTGAQKAAAVTNAIASDAGSFLKSIGVSDATDAEVQTLASVVGTASANILNAIPARAVATPAAPAATAPAAS